MALTWSEVEERIERAREGLKSGRYKVLRVKPIEDGESRFIVRNGDGVPYAVSFRNGKPTGVCTCPDFIGRKGPACKHTAMVVLAEWPDAFDRWTEKVKALCRPVEPEEPPLIITVQVSDTVWTLCERYGCTREQFWEWNGYLWDERGWPRDANYLQPGWRVRVR